MCLVISSRMTAVRTISCKIIPSLVRLRSLVPRYTTTCEVIPSLLKPAITCAALYHYLWSCALTGKAAITCASCYHHLWRYALTGEAAITLTSLYHHMWSYSITGETTITYLCLVIRNCSVRTVTVGLSPVNSANHKWAPIVYRCIDMR